MESSHICLLVERGDEGDVTDRRRFNDCLAESNEIRDLMRQADIRILDNDRFCPRQVRATITAASCGCCACFSLTVITGTSASWRDCLLYTSDAADEEDSVDLGG